MKLWEVKANALRLMFADSDVNFSYDEFDSGVLYENSNTREKLVRMNDSIRRAIDLYYQQTGQYSRNAVVGFKEGENYLDLGEVLDFGFPTKIEIIGKRLKNLDFFYDSLSKRIFVDLDYPLLQKDSLRFLVYYKISSNNLVDDIEIDELEYELNDLGIPEDVQRMIPYFIKGELYEEDEPTMAFSSKNEYIRYLLNSRNKFSNVQSKVKSFFRRG